MIRNGDDIRVVLDDEDGVTGVAEFENSFEELFDIAEVEPGGGFVEAWVSDRYGKSSGGRGNPV